MYDLTTLHDYVDSCVDLWHTHRLFVRGINMFTFLFKTIEFHTHPPPLIEELDFFENGTNDVLDRLYKLKKVTKHHKQDFEIVSKLQLVTIQDYENAAEIYLDIIDSMI